MTDLEAKVKEYREMKRLAEEAQAVADAIADELKAAMTEAGETKLIIGEYKLSYTDCMRKDIHGRPKKDSDNRKLSKTRKPCKQNRRKRRVLKGNQLQAV